MRDSVCSFQLLAYSRSLDLGERWMRESEREREGILFMCVMRCDTIRWIKVNISEAAARIFCVYEYTRRNYARDRVYMDWCCVYFGVSCEAGLNYANHENCHTIDGRINITLKSTIYFYQILLPIFNEIKWFDCFNIS